MEALSLYLPRWPIDRAHRRWLRDGHAQAPNAPIVLTVLNRDRTLVGACCERASTAGVSVGMPLAEARALLRSPPSPHVEPLDPSGDAHGLRRLAGWAYRYVPRVAIDGTDGLLLDASGCERMYGGIDRLARALLRRLRRAGISACLAAAPTFGSAWALARFGGRSLTTIGREDLPTALDTLPIESLRISPASAEALRAVGVERVGQLRALPRSALASRYGREVLLRLDQALGSAIETIEPVRPRWPIHAEHRFDGPTDRIEAIALSARELVGRIAALLAAKHRGSLSLRVELLRSDLEPLFILVRTSRPCADAAHLWKLLAPKVETAHLGFGVEGVRAMLLRSRRLTEAQGACWSDGHAGRTDGEGEGVARMLDTLEARLEPGRVLRSIAVESHLPERAFDLVAHDRHPPSPVEPEPGLDRPTRLFDRPVPIDVSLLLPDGPLVTFRAFGVVHRVRTCLGPERIAGEWWRGLADVDASGDRDYFRVQTDDGRWVWLFRRVCPDAQDRWFMQGEWA
ncbi:MAG: DNA polymerase Y family protein [Phycisphaeraceae bacterium]|nr:DNA polymerase Y family protein [Phycisphaeraceae bacterium]